MRLLSHAHKQRICAAFASVIKNSAAADHIRPEKFFASMSQGIESLLNEDILDLSPLYASFGGRNPPSVVTGAFMAFESTAKELGLRVRLPDAIQHLPAQLKNQSVKAFDESVVRKKNSSDRPPSHIDWLKQPDTPAPIVNYRQKIELGDRQFKAVSVSDATRIAIADAATWAIKDTEGGAKVNSAQISFTLRQYFDRLYDGHSLDLSPLIRVWKKHYQLDPKEIREGLQRLKLYLGELDIKLDDPLTGLGASDRRLILAKLGTLPELQKLFPPPSDARRRTSSQKPTKKSDRPSSSSTPIEEVLDEQTKQELAEYGLEGKARKEKSPVTLVIAAVLLLVAGILYWDRPIKGLSITAYDPLVPLVSAEMINGAFYGVVDEQRWEKLSNNKRREGAKALGRVLEEESRLKDAIISRPNGRMIIFHDKREKLRVSKEALKK